MKYDFVTRPDRAGMDALAVDMIGAPGGFAPGAPDEGFSAIPMWVADMNFVSFPGIQDAVIERAKHPSFGYFAPRKEYYDSIINWQAVRNGVSGLGEEHIGYENGVLGGVVSALNVLCSRGDNVLLHSPTYIGFTGALTNNGYNIVHSELKKDEQGIFRMDFSDMEKKVTENKIHVMVFCSPHNPVGRVWEQWELEELSRFCEKHDITVISDEIWSDIILKGHKHIPVQSATEYLHDNTAAMYAPSKTFNLAGLIGSYHIIYNKRLRERILKESSLCHYNDMNVLSMHALIGAYTKEGMEWTDEMRSVIGDNVDLAASFFEKVPGVTLSRPQGTYMVFPDFTGWCEDKAISMDELENACWKVGVALQDGRMFHGQHNLRINLALPTAYVKEALDRLGKYVFK
ncbi:MAG: aminotransferase class I/II-fold pyridoxal phosphate-dependent enzyme [Firmicutes bacterium]|nr:aminotransferase class I/II-fold pyridoxal phosphate-dependent enzyme [Bacillota bacterium]